MPATASTSPPRRSRSAASASTSRDMNQSRRSRCATSAACRTWRRSAWPTRRASASKDPPFEIGDEIEIQPGRASTRRARRRCSWARSSPTSPSSRARPRSSPCAPTTSRTACSATARSQTFQDMTVADIVKKVLGENGLHGRDRSTAPPPSTSSSSRAWSPTSTSSTGWPRARTARSASRTGKVFLQQRGNGNGAVPTAEWRKNVKSFKPRVSASQQHDTVKVTSYDPKTKKAIVGEATAPSGVPKVDPGRARARARSSAAPSCWSPTRSRPHADEAKLIAQSTLDKLASGSFEAEGMMEGDPARQGRRQDQARGLRQRSTASTCSAPSRTSTAHGDFRTRFTISGRNPRTLTDVMRPKSERDWTQGLVIGLVTNIKDPDKLGPGAREVPGARRQHGERLGADRAARRRARTPA